MNSNKKLKQLTKTLLAGTCLTVASAKAALATTVDQSQIIGGFGGSFGAATVLPTGTTTVTGTVSGDVGSAVYFEIPGLTSGDIIQVTGSDSNFSSELDVFNSSHTSLAPSQSISKPADVFDIIAPTDGKVVFELPAPVATFTVSIADEGPVPAAVPEPNGMAALGIAVVGAASALRRRVNKA